MVRNSRHKGVKSAPRHDERLVSGSVGALYQISQCLFVWYTYRAAKRQAKLAIEADAVNGAHLKALQLQQHAENNRNGETYKGIRYFRAARPTKRTKIKMQPIRFVHNGDGAPAPDFQQAQLMRQKNQASKELAELVTDGEFASRIIAKQNEAIGAQPQPRLAEVPALLHIEQSILALHWHRAAGRQSESATHCLRVDLCACQPYGCPTGFS